LHLEQILVQQGSVCLMDKVVKVAAFHIIFVVAPV
jgi:hypothetical protein